MAQGFAQGFTSGFGLVSDVFKEKRQAEAQEKQMAFQREQFEEQKRRSTEQEERLKSAEKRAIAADARADLEFSRKIDQEDTVKALQTGNAEFILAHRKLGPELQAQLDPKYRDIYDRLNRGELSIDQLDNQTANILLAPELRRNVGEKTRVNMNPAEKDPAKIQYKNITVLNKGIESVNAVEGRPDVLSLNILVEGVDENGQRIIFTEKMTAGRKIGGEEKTVGVRQAVDYITVGKRAAYDLFNNTPAFRNIAKAYGVGITPDQEVRIADNARANYSRIQDANLKRLESLKESNEEAFSKRFGSKTPYEAAEDVTKTYFGGMDVEQHISSTLQRVKSGNDASQIARIPDLESSKSTYAQFGLQIKNNDEAIRMKNDEFAMQSKYGDESNTVIPSMIRRLSTELNRPITFDEYRQLQREVRGVMEKSKTKELSEGVIGEAINKMVRGGQRPSSSEDKTFVQKSADVVGGGISSLGETVSAADPLGIVGLREGGKAISRVGERVSSIGDTEKKTEQPTVDNRVSSIAPPKYATSITNAAQNANIDPVVLAKIAQTESNFRDDVVSGKTVSSAGAVGIVQMVPKWHKNVDFERVKKDPAYALNEGAMYFRELLNMYGGDYQKAAAAYNWGPGNLSKLIKDKGDNWKMHLPTETKNYLKKVFA